MKWSTQEQARRCPALRRTIVAALLFPLGLFCRRGPIDADPEQPPAFLQAVLAVTDQISKDGANTWRKVAKRAPKTPEESDPADDFRKNLEKALAKDPNNARARIMLAYKYQDQMDYRVALKHISILAAQQPDLADAHYKLGELYYELALLDLLIRKRFEFSDGVYTLLPDATSQTAFSFALIELERATKSTVTLTERGSMDTYYYDPHSVEEHIRTTKAYMAGARVRPFSIDQMKVGIWSLRLADTAPDAGDVSLQRSKAALQLISEEILPPSASRVEHSERAERLLAAILKDLDAILPLVWPLSKVGLVEKEEALDERVDRRKDDPLALVNRAQFSLTRSRMFGGEGYQQAYADCQRAATFHAPYANACLGTILYEASLFDMARRRLYRATSQAFAIGELKVPRYVLLPDGKTNTLLQASLAELREAQQVYQETRVGASAETLPQLFTVRETDNRINSVRMLLSEKGIAAQDPEYQHAFPVFLGKLQPRAKGVLKNATSQSKGLGNMKIVDDILKQIEVRRKENSDWGMPDAVSKGVEHAQFRSTMRALNLQSAGYYRESLTEATRARKMDQTLADPYYVLGSIYYDLALIDLLIRHRVRVESNMIEAAPDERTWPLLQMALAQYAEGERRRPYRTTNGGMITYMPVVTHRRISAREVLEGGVKDLPAHNQEIFRFMAWTLVLGERGPVTTDIVRLGKELLTRAREQPERYPYVPDVLIGRQSAPVSP